MEAGEIQMEPLHKSKPANTKSKPDNAAKILTVRLIPSAKVGKVLEIYKNSRNFAARLRKNLCRYMYKTAV